MKWDRRKGREGGKQGRREGGKGGREREKEDRMEGGNKGRRTGARSIAQQMEGLYMHTIQRAASAAVA